MTLEPMRRWWYLSEQCFGGEGGSRAKFEGPAGMNWGIREVPHERRPEDSLFVRSMSLSPCFPAGIWEAFSTAETTQ